MTATLVPQLPSAELSTLTNEQLLVELRTLFNVTAANLMRMSAIVIILDQRRVDLREFSTLVPHLRRIAKGSLVAEVAERLLLTKPTALKHIASLPNAVQLSLAANPVVKVYDPGDGQVHTIAIDDLRDRQLGVVFAEGRIRTPEQQKAILIGPKNKKRSEEAGTPRYWGIHADHENQCLKVGRMSVNPDDVLRAVAELVGPLAPIDVKGSKLQDVATKVTPEEKQRLATLIDSTGLPEWHVIRLALHAFGALTTPKPVNKEPHGKA